MYLSNVFIGTFIPAIVIVVVEILRGFLIGWYRQAPRDVLDHSVFEPALCFQAPSEPALEAPEILHSVWVKRKLSIFMESTDGFP